MRHIFENRPLLTVALKSLVALVFFYFWLICAYWVGVLLMAVDNEIVETAGAWGCWFIFASLGSWVFWKIWRWQPAPVAPKRLDDD